MQFYTTQDRTALAGSYNIQCRQGTKGKTDKIEAIFGPPKQTDTKVSQKHRLQYRLKLGALKTKLEYQVLLSCQGHDLTSLTVTYTYMHTNTQTCKYGSTDLQNTNTAL